MNKYKQLEIPEQNDITTEESRLQSSLCFGAKCNQGCANCLYASEFLEDFSEWRATQ
jgi:hypothetical protein